MPICSAIRSPSSRASYSDSFLLALNVNLIAEMNYVPSGLVSTSPAPEPFANDDPSMYIVHGSENFSYTSIGSFVESSSGHSTMNSPKSVL